MESTIARDSRRTPISRIFWPPFWKPFSITIPAPSSVAPDSLTILMSPSNAHPFARKFLGQDHIIYFLMCEGFYLGTVHFTIKIQTLGFFGKNDRYIKILCGNTGNTDAGCLNSEDFSNRTICETSFKLFADLVDESNIHLMIQKTVYLQNISWFYDSIFQYTVL